MPPKKLLFRFPPKWRDWLRGEDLILHRTMETGDCFFDAVAKALNAGLHTQYTFQDVRNLVGEAAKQPEARKYVQREYQTITYGEEIGDDTWREDEYKVKFWKKYHRSNNAFEYFREFYPTALTRPGGYCYANNNTMKIMLHSHLKLPGTHIPLRDLGFVIFSVNSSASGHNVLDPPLPPPFTDKARKYSAAFKHATENAVNNIQCKYITPNTKYVLLLRNISLLQSHWEYLSWGSRTVIRLEEIRPLLTAICHQGSKALSRSRSRRRSSPRYRPSVLALRQIRPFPRRQRTSPAHQRPRSRSPPARPSVPPRERKIKYSHRLLRAARWLKNITPAQELQLIVPKITGDGNKLVPVTQNYINKLYDYDIHTLANILEANHII